MKKKKKLLIVILMMIAISMLCFNMPVYADVGSFEDYSGGSSWRWWLFVG